MKAPGSDGSLLEVTVTGPRESGARADCIASKTFRRFISDADDAMRDRVRPLKRGWRGYRVLWYSNLAFHGEFTPDPQAHHLGGELTCPHLRENTCPVTGSTSTICSRTPPSFITFQTCFCAPTIIHTKPSSGTLVANTSLLSLK